jgi:YHS domain-containing protein
MRRIARPAMTLLLALLVPGTLHAQQALHWEVSLDNAKRIAAQTNRLVLAHFSADWCQACRAMESEVHSQQRVIETIEASYVPVRINVDHYPQTARQYGITALPTEVILAPTPQGEVLDVIRGRIDSGQYTARLSQIAADAKRPRQPVYAQVPAGPPPSAGRAEVSAAQANVGPPPVVDRPGIALADDGPPLPAPAMAGPAMGGNAVIASGGPPGPPSANPPTQAGYGPPSTQQPPLPPQLPQPPEQTPLALDGFCPVQLVERATWTPGNKAWGARHRGRIYLFAGPEEQRRFLADPDRFAPVNSGNDLVLTVEKNRAVPGTREHGVYFGGRVYLFADETSLQKFGSNPNFYAQQAVQAMRTDGPGGQMR